MSLEQSGGRLYVVKLTRHEARALRLASIFGTPDPEPPDITAAMKKLREVEDRAAREDRRIAREEF